LTLARKAKKLSQEALAELIGKSKLTVLRWENGQSQPAFEDIELLAKVLDVTIGFLFEQDQPTAPNPDPAQETNRLLGRLVGLIEQVLSRLESLEDEIADSALRHLAPTGTSENSSPASPDRRAGGSRKT